MQIFQSIGEDGHEQVVFCHDPKANYRGIIAIHDTTLGPALGGTRLWNYETDADALVDVLRLSRAMTYKAAVAGLNLGGGKAVIIGDPKVAGKERELLFRAHGRFIETLGGRYITAEDVGTSVEDMECIRKETRHVAGTAGRSGDPSPLTAYGVYCGIKAAARERYGDESLRGLRVAVQGLGHVGFHLCELLSYEGAELVVTDIDAARVQRAVETFGAEAVAPERIYGVKAAIFAPCALGGVVNEETIPQFGFDIIAGAANNQLAEARHGHELARRGILYAPDYVINAGGLINVCGELEGWPAETARRKAGEIYETLRRVFELAREEGIPTHEAADRMAEQRLREASKVPSSAG